MSGEAEMSFGGIDWTKNSFTLRVSREMALDCGAVEPTLEEVAERAERAAEATEKRRAAWETYDAATVALSAIAERPEMDVLELHKPVDNYGRPTCDGCDMDGYEAESPEWPCRTVETIAAYRGIELPNSTWLWGTRPVESA